MTPKSISEKPARTYRSALRREQAEATRNRILQEAAELFAADGYARTTMAKIAAAAGVSAETVQGQGTKTALLIAAIDYAAFGVVGEKDIRNLDVGRKLMAIDQFDEALDFMVAAYIDVHQRTAKLAVALGAGASADPELDRYQADLMTSIKQQMRRILDGFRGRGWLRDDVSFDELVDTTTVLGSVEVYVRLTESERWEVTDYERWLHRMLTETVFAVPQAN